METFTGTKYENKGIAQGAVARKPFLTKRGAALLIICTRNPRYNKKAMRQEMVYPKFVAYGQLAERAMADAVTGQEIRVEYHLETKRIVKPDGTIEYLEDKVITSMALGRTPTKKNVQVEEVQISNEQPNLIEQSAV